MIPAIILMLIRRYQKNHPQQMVIIKAKLRQAAKLLLPMAVTVCLVIVSNAQEKNLSYIIKKNGSRIGEMNVKEIRNGSRINLKLVSTIKTSFIFTFTATGIEEATYDSGVLVFSSIYQKFNGSEKINKKTKYVNNYYIIDNKGDEEKLENTRIYYNLVCVYSHEPGSTKLIYSDKYEKFLGIQQVDDHHYKIRFPDGSANDYWYQKGVCTKVEIDHSFFTVVMELNQ